MDAIVVVVVVVAAAAAAAVVDSVQYNQQWNGKAANCLLVKLFLKLLTKV